MERLDAAELDFTRFVRPGDLVVWGQGCGEALSLTQPLLAQRQRIGAFRVFLGVNFSMTVQPEQADTVEFVGLGGAGSARRLARAGVLDVAPLHMTTVDAFMRDGRIQVDVVLVQASRTDRSGEYSLGLSSDYVRGAIGRARVVVAELNDQVPATRCAEPLRDEDIDAFVDVSRAPVELAPAPFGEVERAIAAHVAPFIPERATLQIGLGVIPEAILASLKGRRGLGVHSGVVGDRVADLMESGAVTNEHKDVDTGVTTTCLLIGTKRLYDFADRNPGLLMAPVSRTHGFDVVSRLQRFVALNSAVEVDLTGQVNAEAVGKDAVGLVGGQVDYIRAANASRGGCAIIALPSIAGGNASRIVDRLSGPVTTARSDVGVVVTEFGAADLRGASLRQRARMLIDIAHPAHRERLERAGHALRGRAVR
ncbi:MAG: acetyl-CoA hydrolase/transferase family protein [Chloroflexi bacterium]|nr:acetyl-CoA hydrolase/transferase family protein [Chloroflexota bacterium]